MRSIFPRALTLLACAAALAACNGSTGSGTHALAVTATGRVERGGDVALAVTDGGAAVPLAQVTWAVSPAGAAAVDAAGHAHLSQAVPITFVASAGGHTGQVRLDVPLPPTVVFDRLANGSYDVWQVSLDGGELKQLTTSTFDDIMPAAAHGTVAFVSYRTGNAELYTLPVGGGAETRITTTAANEAAPALSRDGTRIAFTNDASGVDKLWTAAVNGSGAAPAAPAFGFGGSIDASPSWAPSGRLAFVSTANGSPDIFGFTPPGTPTLVVGGTFADIQPSYGPDGSKLAFVSNRDGDTELYMLDVATSVVTRLTTRVGTDAEPGWLPDGRLVFTSFTGGVATLHWLDPAAPAVIHDIPSGGSGRHPTGVL
ncbi:MAG: dpp5 [Gemmatimonadetes bacterium]|nr:dpp5 [Gemmatimonadota bacterium]